MMTIIRESIFFSKSRAPKSSFSCSERSRRVNRFFRIAAVPPSVGTLMQEKGTTSRLFRSNPSPPRKVPPTVLPNIGSREVPRHAETSGIGSWIVSFGLIRIRSLGPQCQTTGCPLDFRAVRRHRPEERQNRRQYQRG